MRLREAKAGLAQAIPLWAALTPCVSENLSAYQPRKELSMMKTRSFLSLGVAALAIGLGACGAALAADTVALGAKLSGANEVPANASPGTGALDASVDKQTGVLTWTVTYAGLTGPAKAGHFHGPAAAGANAGVALGFTGGVESPIKGSATLTAAQVDELLAGKWYVNLHTAANPGGEVRGQVMPTP
jgi:hypothetical protein